MEVHVDDDSCHTLSVEVLLISCTLVILDLPASFFGLSKYSTFRGEFPSLFIHLSLFQLKHLEELLWEGKVWSLKIHFRIMLPQSPAPVEVCQSHGEPGS